MNQKSITLFGNPRGFSGVLPLEKGRELNWSNRLKIDCLRGHPSAAEAQPPTARKVAEFYERSSSTPKDCTWQLVVHIRLIWHRETWISSDISDGRSKVNSLRVFDAVC
jgi:hypothetical protein